MAECHNSTVPTTPKSSNQIATFFITHRNPRRTTPVYSLTLHLPQAPSSVTDDIRDQVSTLVKSLKDIPYTDDDGKEDLSGSDSDSTHPSKPSQSSSSSVTAKHENAAYIARRRHFCGKEHCLINNAGNELVSFNPPWWSTSATPLNFPSGSPHSRHPITMKPVTWTRRAEEFVLDSVTYTWRVANAISVYDYTLWKSVGGKGDAGHKGGENERAVAKYSQLGVLRKGGVFVVDRAEVDEVVALVTCMTVLWKIMMRGC